MQKSIYKDKSRQDLTKALMEKRDDFRKLRFGTAGSKTHNVKAGAGIRKEIARIMTELSK